MPLATRELTQLHRRKQLALRTATLTEMARLWPALDWADLDATYPAFAGSVAAVVAKNRRTSAGVAAQYLRAFRVAAGLGGNLRILIPQTFDLEQFANTLHPLTVAAIKTASANSTPQAEAMGNALTRSSGAMARLVLDAGRQTVNQTIATDGRATGWRRILGGTGCDFCRELAGRVYPTDNADFEAHGKCGCTSEPVYE